MMAHYPKVPFWKVEVISFWKGEEQLQYSAILCCRVSETSSYSLHSLVHPTVPKFQCSRNVLKSCFNLLNYCDDNSNLRGERTGLTRAKAIVNVCRLLFQLGQTPGEDLEYSRFSITSQQCLTTTQNENSRSNETRGGSTMMNEMKDAPDPEE
jgi:hypothetical protein